MGAETKIQWCHHTLNPWIGCAKVSAGCSHCYAEVQTYPRVSKARGLPLWGAAAARHVTSDANWREPVRWNRAALAAGERRRVFCASLADVFEGRDDLDAHRARLWELIEATPALDWLLLTKRPEQVMQRIPERWRGGLPANVWVGTTVESQAMADERIPHLLSVPARVRFLSCEPLLERVNLHRWLCKHATDQHTEQHVGPWCDPAGSISWVIIGGESGPRARPLDVSWVRDLAYQCRDADVATFVKQFGDHVIWNAPLSTADYWPIGTRIAERLDDVGARIMHDGWRVRLNTPAGGDPAEWPEELRVREFPAGATR